MEIVHCNRWCLYLQSIFCIDYLCLVSYFTRRVQTNSKKITVLFGYSTNLCSVRIHPFLPSKMSGSTTIKATSAWYCRCRSPFSLRVSQTITISEHATGYCCHPPFLPFHPIGEGGGVDPFPPPQQWTPARNGRRKHSITSLMSLSPIVTHTPTATDESVTRRNHPHHVL